LKAISKKKDEKTNENPFKMPPDSDIFVLREKEKQQKLKVSESLVKNRTDRNNLSNRLKKIRKKKTTKILKSIKSSHTIKS